MKETKKYFSLLAMAAMTAFSLTSCDEEEGGGFVLLPVETSEGVFVLNSGHVSGGIASTLTYYDYATGSTTQSVYQAANGVSLGGTINHAVVYGSKIYIVGTDERTVFVADRKTLKKIANVPIMVNGEAATPREVVTCCTNGHPWDGYVYVSTYNNAVVAIDTLTNTIAKTFASGNYSEGMVIYKQYLYVADSNYGSGFTDNSSPSISQIDLTTGKTTTFTHESIKNPADVKIARGRMFILDSGLYDESWNQVGACVYELADGAVKKIADATDMAVMGYNVYMVNAPFTTPSTTPSYWVYDTRTNKLETFCDGSDIEYPAKISADLFTGDFFAGRVFITSYHIGSSGYPDYTGPGYCVVYDENSKKQGQFDCGVGAGRVIPNTGVGYTEVPL